MWDPTRASAAHANLSAFLAGFAITLLVINFGPLTQGGATPKALRNLEDAVVRQLLAAFAMLAVSATLWGGLSGYAPTAAPSLSRSMLALAGVLVLVLGSLMFFAGAIEIVTVQVARRSIPESDLTGKIDRSSLAEAKLRHKRITKSAGHVYLGLLLLALWEIAAFVTMIATSWPGLSLWPQFDVWMPLLVVVVALAVRRVHWLDKALKRLMRLKANHTDSWWADWISARRAAGYAAGIAVAATFVTPEELTPTGPFDVWYVVSAWLLFVAASLTIVTISGTRVVLGWHARDALRAIKRDSSAGGGAAIDAETGRVGKRQRAVPKPSVP